MLAGEGGQPTRPSVYNDDVKQPSSQQLLNESQAKTNAQETDTAMAAVDT